LVEVSKFKPQFTVSWCCLGCFLWNSNHLFPSSCKILCATFMWPEWKFRNSKEAPTARSMNILILRRWIRMFCGEKSHLFRNYECRKWGFHFRSNDEQIWHTPKLLDGLNYESKGEDSRRKRSWAHSLAHNTSRVEVHVGAPGWD
jgi:hypothetical protein